MLMLTFILISLSLFDGIQVLFLQSMMKNAMQLMASLQVVFSLHSVKNPMRVKLTTTYSTQSKKRNEKNVSEVQPRFFL